MLPAEDEMGDANHGPLPGPEPLRLSDYEPPDCAPENPMTTTTAELPESPPAEAAPVRHPIPIRRPHFDFSESIPRHWAGGNAFATHMFNATNLLFPEGERFFIRAVNDYMSEIADPGLRAQARAFAGQEAVHGQQHEAYFEAMRAQGYEIDGYLRAFHVIERTMSLFPRSIRLATTAGAEHYTATLGHFALTAQHRRDFHPTMQKLIVWHAAEEVEHKAVAFDIMQSVGIGYAKRIFGFVLATVFIGGFSAIVGRRLMRQDGMSGAQIRASRRELMAKEQGRDGKALRFAGRQLKAYFRRDFHPGEIDDLDIAHAGLTEVGLETAAA